MNLWWMLHLPRAMLCHWGEVYWEVLWFEAGVSWTQIFYMLTLHHIRVRRIGFMSSSASGYKPEGRSANSTFGLFTSVVRQLYDHSSCIKGQISTYISEGLTNSLVSVLLLLNNMQSKFKWRATNLMDVVFNQLLIQRGIKDENLPERTDTAEFWNHSEDTCLYDKVVVWNK